MASWTSRRLQKETVLGEEGWAETWPCPSLSAAASTDPTVTIKEGIQIPFSCRVPRAALAAMPLRKLPVLFYRALPVDRLLKMNLFSHRYLYRKYSFFASHVMKLMEGLVEPRCPTLY